MPETNTGATSAKKSLIRFPEVLKRSGLCRSAIYNRLAAGTFPQPIKLDVRAIAWVDTEIDEWVNATIAASRLGD